MHSEDVVLFHFRHEDNKDILKRKGQRNRDQQTKNKLHEDPAGDSHSTYTFKFLGLG